MLSLFSQQHCDAIRAFERRQCGGGLLRANWSVKPRMEEQMHMKPTGERFQGSTVLSGR